MINKKSSIFIVGDNIIARGLCGYFEKNSFINTAKADLKKTDYTNSLLVYKLFKRIRPQYCFLTHIKEGGIEANIQNPAKLLYENISIQTNIIEASRQAGVKRLIYLGSSCVYPKDSPCPIKESGILTGSPEPTSEAFAISKIAGIKMCQSYNRQHKTDFVSVIPATVYGPTDNFDAGSSHVIPGLIKRFCQAKEDRKPFVIIWGSGRPRREFIYIDDIIDGLLLIAEKKKVCDLINLGVGDDISIKELGLLIKDITGYSGKLKFDKTKPDGSYRKLLDSSKIRLLGFRPKTDLKAGIKETLQYFLKQKFHK